MVQYEYPFNEKIRFFLRLEDLFKRIRYFLEQPAPEQHQVALTTLFELLDITQRSDIKSDLISELDKQKQGLVGLRANPNVDDRALEQLIQNIDETIALLSANYGKVGQELRTHEWLNSVRSRASIPGGLCRFDLPSFYAWQQRSDEVRRQFFNEWLEPFLPIEKGVNLLLHLTREFGVTQHRMAVKGAYQEMLSGKTYQLLRLRIPLEKNIFPEISANKYLISIRFFVQGTQLNGIALTQDLPFELTLCNYL